MERIRRTVGRIAPSLAYLGLSLEEICNIGVPGLTGVRTLSMWPQVRSRATTRLMVERLTFSLLAMPFQSGRTMCVAGSIRCSSDSSTRLSMSHGSVGGRPRCLPVALWFFITGIIS